MTVTPMNDLKEADGLLLVTFEDLAVESGSQSANDGRSVKGMESSIVEQLQHELKATTEDLQSTIEELESSNEELRISHEEAMSTNEELQSANEELKSSKEELQSLNEELTTVNSQLPEKVDELDRANSDISNLMVSADIATLFLDEQLCRQRFTPPAAKLLNLRDADVGRPFHDFSPTLHDGSLLNECRRVMRNNTTIEKEVWSIEPQESGTFDRTVGHTDTKSTRRCYLRRIVPYRSSDHGTQGVVMTLLDITSRIDSEAEARRLATVLRDSNDAVVVVDPNGRITTWNAGAAHMYGYSEAEALQLNMLDNVPGESQQAMQAIDADQSRSARRFV